VISNEVFDAAWEDPDNRGIIRSVLRRYTHLLPHEELRSLGLLGLWQALKKHDPSYGQKFTSSLHRHVNWQIKQELRKRFGHKGCKIISFSPIPESHPANESPHFLEHLDSLGDSHRKLLSQRFLENMTFTEIGLANGYNRSIARARVEEALQAARCINSV
jgi:DNA-directed RNA polymerase specialized sigma subunit